MFRKVSNMTKEDLIRRGALEKLEEIVRSCVQSCNRNLENFRFEMIDVFSQEEHNEIDYMIEKLKDDKDYLKLFCQIRGII